MLFVRPTLILDKIKCFENIRIMCEKAQKLSIDLRPHFKTHRSAEIASWFKQFDIEKCTVSSIEMAEYFSANGWNDITIAFPVNILEISSLNKIPSHVKLNLLVDNKEVVEFLNHNLTRNVNLFLKIDTGYHRCGIETDNLSEIESIICLIDNIKNLTFKGFLVHSGNTYQAISREEIVEIHNNSRLKLINLKSKFNLKEIIISTGDTPSCSLADNFKGIDEIRPGNFVFYDTMQFILGSCSFNQIAVCLACPVVSKNSDRNEVVIYGGSVHLSKESVKYEGINIFGLVVEITKNGWKQIEGAYVKSLSQEHGVISISGSYFNKIKIGTVLGIIPVHSCLTVGLMRKYHVLQTGEYITTCYDIY